ncbi:MAG: LCP family protein [Lachnospiraceae bacterium]|nr:LCP family protein [Lachnospiraceae bacterium]
MKVRMREGANRILARILIGLVVVVVVLLVGFVALQVSGKHKLNQAKVGGKAPWLPTGEDIVLEDQTPDPELEKVWEDDWIRYNGQIYEYNDSITTFLILGIDKYNAVKEAKNGILGGQSDVMFLAVLNGDAKRVDLIAINRDTICDVDVYNEAGEYLATVPKQITLQHGYGDGKELSCERTMATVSRLFYGLPIHGYASVNISAIPVINDAVGGVEVTLPHDMEWYKKIDGTKSLKAGTKLMLKGEGATYYIQSRDCTEFNSAGMRLERQKQYLEAYAQRAIAACKEDITMPVKLYKAISKYLVTDISIDEVTYLATTLLGYDFSGANIHSLAGETVATESFEEFHLDQQALYDTIIEVFYKPVETQ